MDGVQIPEIKYYAKSNYQNYAIYIKKQGMRDKIITEMKKKNIQTQIGTYALHMQPAFKKLKKSDKLENSTKLFNNLLSLPLHFELSNEDQKRVVNELFEILKKCR